MNDRTRARAMNNGDQRVVARHMSSSPLELYFRRYRRTRDPRAIAAVYDAVAPNLLLIAAHVSYRGSDAEDLVQATFLAAMESADQWDPDRPLMPWLVGILTNEARQEHRRQARTIDGDRLAARASVDPHDDAAQREFIAALSAALQSLPEHYRHTLTLRLVHGLTPVEIGHALGLSPDTVRTRIRRGQEILKSTLPAGFASSAALALTPKTLASVRALVLERADAIAAAYTARGLGALLTWRVGALLLVGALAVPVLLWGLATRDGPTRLSSGRTATEAASTDTATSRADDVAAPGDANAGGAASQRRATDPAGLRLRVLWHDGAPAADVAVCLTPRDGPDPLLHQRWVTTDRDGIAAIDDLVAASYDVAGDRGGALTAVVAAARAERALTIPRGIDVRGILRGGDPHFDAVGELRGHTGGALAGAAVWLSRSGSLEEGRVVTHTDEHGEFALRDVEPGRVLSILAPGYAPLPLRRIVGNPGDVVFLELDASLERSNWVISGRVADEQGTPIAGARVRIGEPPLPPEGAATSDATIPPVDLVTDQDGGFLRRGLSVFDGVVPVWVRAPGKAVWFESVAFRRPEMSRHLEIRLRTGRTLHGRATDAAGREVAGAVVTANAEDDRLGPAWADASASTDQDGRFELIGLPEDPLRLTAIAADGARASTRRAARDDSAWNMRLAPPGAIRGQVHDGHGEPLAGFLVQALLDGVTALTGETDDHGEFALAPCETRPHALLVRDARSPWRGVATSAAAVDPATPVTTLRVPDERIASATIVGVAVHSDGTPVPAAIVLRNFLGHAQALADEATGAFRIGPLPPLPCGYDVLIESPRAWYAFVPAVHLEAGATRDLGEIELRPPGRVVFAVSAPDGSPAQATAHVAKVGAFFTMPCAIENGHGKLFLPEGSYAIHFPGTRYARGAQRFEVTADRDLIVDVALARGTARRFVFEYHDHGQGLIAQLDWCDAEGEPLCRDHATWAQGAAAETEHAFAPGEYVLRVCSQADRTVEVPFEISADPDPEPVVVDLR